MQEEHLNSPNVFTGVMDLDNDLTVVSKQDYRYALAIRNGLGAIPGAATNVKGNCLVEYPLPEGENVCIGTVEDKRCVSVIYFVWNSNNEHLILRYFPQKKDASNPCGVIELVSCGEVLNFNKDWIISHAAFIDNKLLYWTDSFTEKGLIEGNPPRKINVEKGNITGKELEYEIHVDRAETFLETLPANNIDLAFVNIGTAAAFETITVAQLTPFQGDPIGFLEYLKDRLDNPTGPTIFVKETEFCECKLKIKMEAPNGIATVVDIMTIGTDDVSSDFILVPVNHYGAQVDLFDPLLPYVCSLKEQNISLIKKSPTCEPTVCHILDNSVDSNNVNNNLFQFRTRYWYDDNEKSAWSAISNISSPLDFLGNFLDTLNAIEVDFTEDILNDPYWRSMITKVEVAFRVGNIGLFKTIEVIDICDIGLKKNFINFYNDLLYSVVPSDDEGEANTQVLKKFDAVPRLSGGVETIADRKGNNRIFLSANLENYDKPDCVDLDFSTDSIDVDECLITIKGTVNINTFPLSSPMIVKDGFGEDFDVNDGFSLFFSIGGNVAGGFGNINGVVVYLAGTDYFGISNNNVAVVRVSDRDGSFEIRNVPKGKYTIRVASLQCDYSPDFIEDNNGNSLGNIDLLDLNNGLAWQRTSAPVLDCAGSLAATGVPYEREIDLTGFVGPVFDLDTEVGYGNILIEHPSQIRVLNEVGVTGQNNSKYFMGGYYRDNEADANDNSQRVGAIGCERQKITGQVYEGNGLGDFFPTNFEVTTDHNGYWFHTWKVENRPSIVLQSFRFKNIYPTVPSPCANTFIEQRNVLGTNFIFNGKQYTGGVAALSLDVEFELTVGPTPGSYDPNGIYFGPEIPELMLYNTSIRFTEENKTLVRGKVVDSSGFGLSNCLVVVNRNGRQERTDSNGDFTIAAYCPRDQFVRNDDDIYVQYLLDKCSNLTPVPSTQTLNIDKYCQDFNSTTPFFVNDFVYPTSGPLTSKEKYLKSGGVYRTGVVYEDEYGRQATVSVSKNDFRVPYHTVYGFYEPVKIKWSILSKPPVWAKRFRIVRTKESFYRRYLHELIEDVQYVIVDDLNQTPIDTSFANGNASHILIKVSDILGLSDNNSISWFFKKEEENNFEPEQRDRIRFILDNTGSIIDPGKITDVRIEGVYLENDDYYYVIQNEETFNEILPGTLIEIYTPKKIEETIYYETGECHEILDAGTEDRRHSGPLFDQDFTTGQAAEGYLVGGDTYWRTRDFGIEEGLPYNNRKLESSNYSDRFDSTYEDIGRVNIQDDDFGERFYYNRIRFSGLYVPNSKLNGLSSFGSADFQDLDVDFGIVKRIIAVDTVLLSVCEYKIQPIYVGKDNLLNLDGGTGVGRSDRILNLANELKEDLGTMNPESIIEYQGWVYGWDVYKGVMWRYASNGVFPISSYKAQKYFNDLGENLLPQSRKANRVFGGIERKYSAYLTTFVDDGSYLIDTERQTISFSEGKNGFNTFQPFIPEYYGVVGNLLVSFKNGNLWLHESDEVPYNNFYDTQYTSKIQPVFNLAPKAVKIPWNIELQADNLWFSPLIETPPNFQYPIGMRSRLKAGCWDNTEGTWKADFRRDINDPSPQFANITPLALKETTALLRGRPLRCEVMTVMLELNTPEVLSILKRMDIESNLSNDTKT